MIKNQIFILLFLSAILTSGSCSESKNTDQKNNSIPAKIERVTEKKEDQETQQNLIKEPDSINSKNTVDFLTAYGELNKETKILIETRLGNIKLVLYKDTPLHRANFIFLTKIGYFSTTCFYRVVPDFIIQGGNSESMNTLGYRNKYKHYKLPSEFRKNRKHKYGAIAAARDWENNPLKLSTAFEFYIVQNKKGAFHLDGEHTVFGEVISGFQVIDKIVNLKAGGDEWPLEDVFIKASVIK